MSQRPLPHLNITDPEQLRLLLAESYRHNEYLQQMLDEARAKRFWRFNEEEHWLWDSEGNNYLDSLCCPVLISASDMRAIRDSANKLLLSAQDVIGFDDTHDLMERSETVRLASVEFGMCFSDDEDAP